MMAKEFMYKNLSEPMTDQSDKKLAESFSPFEEKMRSAGFNEIVIETFRHHYDELLRGKTGFLSRSEINPVEKVPDLETLKDYSQSGLFAIRKAVTIKLNGGLGTGMGMEKAKSLLEVKHGLSFLDIIARQALHARKKYQCDLPLVLMNSFSTRNDSLAALEKYPELKSPIPPDFLQHKVPKIDQHTLKPIEWRSNPELEWCPPGHGDIYIALVTSGMLDTLLNKGYEYALISNVDNLGAVMNIQILGYFAAQKLPFMMEVADRTEADRKGGHLARLTNGNLTLRELAQCPEDEQEAFQDITLYNYFNTNTLWVNLISLKDLLDKTSGRLFLPLICNRKTVDPRDNSSPKVFQLETAMGSAIAAFPGAQALRVPRTRFAPVKACVDLLGLWSDAYIITEDSQVIQNPKRTLGPIVIELDPRYYKLFNEMKARFPQGAPSLIECRKLVVEGDVCFGRNVKIRGNVRISNSNKTQLLIPDGEVIEGT